MMRAQVAEIRTRQPAQGALELTKALAAKIALNTPSQGLHAIAIDALVLYRKDDPSPCYPANYELSVHVFTQGQKRVTLGGSTYLCKPSTFLLSSIDVPVVSQVIEASSAKPLLSFVLKLDLAMVREILAKGEFHNTNATSMDRALALGDAREDLLQPCLRLIDLLDAPQDIPFLSKLIESEIVYRLLRGPKGERLCAIATLGAQSHKTANAVAWLRTNYKKPLSLEELANVANMGTSTLHHHFRALTAMSPLQYQKQLRLVAARERMLAGGIDAASAAFEVGYESASQFNREYKRFFGQPPITDVKLNRSGSL
jgi:AraC-like DNA-binding protein